MTTVSSIALHHGGGTANAYYASSKDLTAPQVNEAHRTRWAPFAKSWPAYKSSLGYFGGYNFFIDKFGTLTQFRAIGEETAAQIGSNFDTVSICLAGNFSINPKTKEPVDIPTQAQINMLKDVMLALLNKDYHIYGMAVMGMVPIDIKFQNIHPHRFYQVGTECNGTFLPDNWGQQLIIDHFTAKLNLLQQLLLKIRLTMGSLKTFARTPLERLQGQCEDFAKG